MDARTAVWLYEGHHDFIRREGNATAQFIFGPISIFITR